MILCHILLQPLPAAPPCRFPPHLPRLQRGEPMPEASSPTETGSSVRRTQLAGGWIIQFIGYVCTDTTCDSSPINISPK